MKFGAVIILIVQPDRCQYGKMVNTHLYVPITSRAAGYSHIHMWQNIVLEMR